MALLRAPGAVAAWVEPVEGHLEEHLLQLQLEGLHPHQMIFMPLQDNMTVSRALRKPNRGQEALQPLSFMEDSSFQLNALLLVRNLMQARARIEDMQTQAVVPFSHR